MNKSIVLLKQKTFINLLKIPLLEKLYWKRLEGFKSASVCAPQMLQKAFQRAKDLNTLSKGDYYEFGIFNGYSIYCAQQIAKKEKFDKMKFFGFDSFKGLPEVSKEDEGWNFKKGQFARSKKDVIKNIVSHDGDLKSLILIEGYFEDSLKKSLIQKHKMKKISIAYIDCDLYSSTKEVLSFIKPLLMKNSLIIFDDWDAFLNKEKSGEQLAFMEFTKLNPQIKFAADFSYCWHGQAMRVV